MSSGEAVVLVARAEIRRRSWSLLLAVLVVTLVVGVVFASAAGARRTSSVLDRLQARYPQPDLWIGLSDPGFANDVARLDALEAQLATLDGVEEVEGGPNIFVLVDGDGEREFSFSTDADANYLTDMRKAVRVIDGRYPAIDGAMELAINEAAAEALRLEVGDEFVAPTFTVETAIALAEGRSPPVADGPEFRFDVVGVYRDSLDVAPVPGAIASPDTGAFIGRAAAFEAGYALYGDPSAYFDQALALAAQAAPDAYVYFSEIDTRIAPVRSAFDMLAVGLVVLSLVAAVAGLIATGQLVSREVNHSAVVVPTLRALGMDRRPIVLGLAAPSIAAVALGVGLGAIAAVAASPMFPRSAARLAEPDPGVDIDWVVLLVGSSIIVVMMSAWALFTSSRQVRGAPVASTLDRGSRWVGVRSVLPVPVAIGVGSMTTSGHHRARARPGSAIVGTVLGVAGLVGVAVFLASLDTTTSDLRRFGWDFDRAVFIEGVESPGIIDAVAADDRVAAVGTASCSDAIVSGSVTSLCALEVLSGSMALTYLDGRAPGSDDEIAVGRVTMNDHDIELGDVIEVTGRNDVTSSLTVVGTVVQPDPNAPGVGLVTTPARFRALVDDASDLILLLRYPTGADVAALDASLTADHSLDYLGGDSPTVPDALRQIERVRPSLIALVIFLGVLGVAGLTHFLLLSGSRRRHETAVLRAIGFVRHQAVAVVVWQAIAIVAIGVAIGVPVGIAIGRAVWLASVDQIGIVDDPTMPWLATAAIVGAAASGAAVVAVLSGWWSSRRRPGLALRTE